MGLLAVIPEDASKDLYDLPAIVSFFLDYGCEYNRHSRLRLADFETMISDLAFILSCSFHSLAKLKVMLKWLQWVSV